MTFAEYYAVFNLFKIEFAQRAAEFRDEKIRKMLWNDLIDEFDMKYPGFKEMLERE